jgi:hypothetical protein
MTDKKDLVTREVDEITSLNLNDLDVEELERRLELAVGMSSLCYVDICGIDGCGVNCPYACGANCSNLCAADVCYCPEANPAC